MSELSRLVSKVCLWVSGTGLCLMTVIIMWQVFARYVLNASPSWSEQLALYLMVWTVLLAAAAGVREGFHIRITVFQDSLTKTPRRMIIALCHLITGAVGLFMVVTGIEIVGRTWGIDIPALAVPRGSALLPIPMAGVLITLFTIEHLVNMARGKEVDALWS